MHDTDPREDRMGEAEKELKELKELALTTLAGHLGIGRPGTVRSTA